jgi:catechol 2,3-dioxygenase-like lactoylglutathione lyase family enzyme
VVPDIHSTQPTESRAFYGDFLGLTLAMDLGFIQTYVSPVNPTAQISILQDAGGTSRLPDISVEVADVDGMHARAVARGLEIVYPLTDEPWGVRRFFVLDPDGTVVNVLSHRPSHAES